RLLKKGNGGKGGDLVVIADEGGGTIRRTVVSINACILGKRF
ncbi:unnamed protein product, partial [Urochloa humidicola]